LGPEYKSPGKMLVAKDIDRYVIEENLLFKNIFFPCNICGSHSLYTSVLQVTWIIVKKKMLYLSLLRSPSWT
jgi:hypothetical protein